VTRRRTCRTSEGPEATSQSSSPDVADHSMHADDAARVRLNVSDYRLARSQVDLLVARQVPASRPRRSAKTERSPAIMAD
jgi:hypothetical protein